MSTNPYHISQSHPQRRNRVSRFKEHTEVQYTDQGENSQRESWNCEKEACESICHVSECPIEGCTQRWKGYGTSEYWYISFLIIRAAVTHHIAEEHPFFVEPIDLVFVYDGTYWCLNLCIGSWNRCPMEDCDWRGEDGRSVTAHRQYAHPNEGPIGTLLPPYYTDPTACALRMGEGGLAYSMFRPAEYTTAAQPARHETSVDTSTLPPGNNNWSGESSPTKIVRQSTPYPSFMRRRHPSKPTGQDSIVLSPTPCNLPQEKHVQNFIQHFGQLSTATDSTVGDNARVTDWLQGI